MKFLAVVIVALLAVFPASAENAPGITASEIKIGATFPFSGPVSSLGNIGKSLLAYVKSINERGGINGRKINLIALDDSFSPPKTMEQTRKLVEGEEVAFLIGSLGTATNSAVARYLASKKVPSLFIMSGAAKFANYADYPNITMGMASYLLEGRVYAEHIKRSRPDSKVAILYQNDDLGRDYIAAFKAAFGAQFDARVAAVSYEVTEPTVDSQIVKLKASGAEVLFLAVTPKFAAQALRKVNELGWDVLRIVNYPSASMPTLEAIGLDKAKGILSANYAKGLNDPVWRDDAGMKQYRAFFEKYLPGHEFMDGTYLNGFTLGMLLEQVLKQCGEDLSRENVARQARNVRGLVLPMALPGIVVNTSERNNQAWTQFQLQQWNGKSWDKLGDVVGSGEH